VCIDGVPVLVGRHREHGPGGRSGAPGRSRPATLLRCRGGGPPLTRVSLAVEHALDAAIPRGLEAGTAAAFVGERLAQCASRRVEIDKPSRSSAEYIALRWPPRSSSAAHLGRPQVLLVRSDGQRTRRPC
jgi:hypothetical protein